MRFFFRLFVWLILLSPFAFAFAIWLALGDTPAVVAQSQLSHQDIARARTLIKKNDPRQFAAGSQHTFRVSQADLNLAANYLLQQLGGAARVNIGNGSADLVATVRIPQLPIKPYINIRVSVVDADGLPQIRGLQVGKVPVPNFLVTALAQLVLAQLYDTPRYQLAEEVVQELYFRPGEAAITYVWQPDLIEQAKHSLLSGHDRESLVGYHNYLVTLQAQGIARSGSLVDALKPLFAQAEQRSETGDPVAENRALIWVLGAWSTGRGMGQLVPPSRRQGELSPFRLSLEGRKDFAQHFLASAALASAGDTALADAVGLFKEVKDADTGSGFSFTDLAADRAGTRFGELATDSAAQARSVQQEVAAGVEETAIMPRVRDLPEHMMQAEFERRFGAVGSPRYNQVKDEIERRIAACSLYRGR